MFPNTAPAPPRARFSRWFTTVAILLATVVIAAGSSVAVAAQAAERTDRATAARSSAIAAVGHRVGLGASGIDPGVARLATARAIAVRELGPASALLATSAGQATDAARQALQTAVDALSARVESGASVDRTLAAFAALRSSVQVVAGEVAAWQAEQARLAAEAAAAAAAAAASAAQSAAVSSSSSGSGGWVAPAAAAPAPSSGAAIDPANCGPCNGQALVPFEWEGVTYVACP